MKTRKQTLDTISRTVICVKNKEGKFEPYTADEVSDPKQLHALRMELSFADFWGNATLKEIPLQSHMVEPKKLERETKAKKKVVFVGRM